ncbi:MAG: ABC transporter permease [Epsilonproteobacteria bacterium]|nr:MAG: ABC transporter permease [Campylobacterota bacterium]
MRLRVVKAYFIKEMIELIRTKMIMMPYLMPLLIVILFGYGIKMQVTGVRTLILDNDNSQISRKLILKFEHSKYFTTEVKNMSEKEALREIKKANIDALVIIPSSFEKNSLKGVKTEMGVFIDASFPSRATTISNYIQGIILDLANDFHMDSSGVININTRNLFNQALRDEEMIVPGLIGMVLLIAPAILTALLIAKEKEMGTIFNFYSSPVSRGEFLVAKLSAIFFLVSISIFIIFLVASYLFDLPFRGSFFLFWFASELYVFVALGFGLLVSILASSQIVAIIVTLMLTILPAFMYSGMIMPISSMSGEAFIVAHIYPVMYYNHIIYDTFLIGQGFSSSTNILYLLLLFGYGVVLFTLGLLLLKKEIK